MSCKATSSEYLLFGINFIDANLRQPQRQLFGYYQDNNERAKTTANYSMGFDPKATLSCLTYNGSHAILYKFGLFQHTISDKVYLVKHA